MLRRVAMEPVVERQNLLRFRVARLGQHHARRVYAARIESRLNLLDEPRAADQQPGADQQSHRERHFEADQRRAQAIAASVERASSRAQRALEIRAGQSQRGNESEEYGAHRGAQQCEAEHAEVYARLVQPWNALGAHREHRLEETEGECQAESRAGDREHTRLGDQLSQQPSVSRAERSADRELS
jgi:hypothetical protein